eukprot:3700832-Pyramimonas_sp.AAC.1
MQTVKGPGGRTAPTPTLHADFQVGYLPPPFSIGARASSGSLPIQCESNSASAAWAISHVV